MPSVDEAVLDDEPDVDSGRVSKAGTPGGNSLQLVNFARQKSTLTECQVKVSQVNQTQLTPNLLTRCKSLACKRLRRRRGSRRRVTSTSPGTRSPGSVLFPHSSQFPELLDVCPPGVWHEPTLHLPPGEVRPPGEEQHDGLHPAHHDPHHRHPQLRLVDGGGGEDGHHHLGDGVPHHRLAKALRTTKECFVLRRSIFVMSFYCYSNCPYLIPSI